MGNKIGRKLSELELLEGGGGSGMMGGGGGGRNISISGIADRNAKRNKTDFVDELIAADKKLAMKRELETVKAKPGRQQAEQNATVRTEDGVKTTTYPYVGANEFAKGGSVSSRADGIAQRGKTRGKMC
jgi:hypothetical protein